MKTTNIILISFAAAITLCGCSATMDRHGNPHDGKYAHDRGGLVGGYTEQRKPNSEEKELFRHVMGDRGRDMRPVSVSTQVVSGINYRFVCKCRAKGRKQEFCVVTIYRPLRGEPVLTSIDKRL